MSEKTNTKSAGSPAYKNFRRMLRWFAVLPALLPAGCHFAWTGPALWSHNSTGAFDAWMFLWLLAIAIPVWVAVWAHNA